MRFFITSDLHLGNHFSQAELFRECLQCLKPGIGIVLGGDTVDDPTRVLDACGKLCIEGLVRESEKRRVIWVKGNHDDHYMPEIVGNIEFTSDSILEDRLFIAHGDNFDNVMPYNRWFIALFKKFHECRVRLGASPVHVADYAKKWGLLYRFLRRNVLKNAVEHAKEIGIDAVACGHVHYAEEQVLEEIRYFNLGSWTEHPPHCLLFDDTSIRLVSIPDALSEKDWFSISES